MDRNIVIAAYRRSPFHPAKKGALAQVRPDDLAAATIRGLVADSGIEPADIEEVILGNAMPEGEQGMNMGRYAVFLAGLPVTVAGTTVNKWCGSSMQAIHNAAGLLGLGAGEACIAAGVESMSRVPMGGFNPAPHPGLLARWPETYHSMGLTAETVAERYQVTRERQQEFAVASHRKAARAHAEGRFADEIVPVEAPDGSTVSADGGIRPDSTVEALDGLKPAFVENGTVTAGTSSPLTDGAAATLICTEACAERHGIAPLARIRAVATAGLEPEIMGMGPVEATRKALDRAGLAPADIDIFELNEAFASQALACIDALGIDPDRVNLDGGAIALGHPLGASGARIAGKAAALLKREGGRFAVAAMCIGGGQGIATVLEAAG